MPEYVAAAIQNGVGNAAIAVIDGDGPRVIKPNGVDEVMPSAVYLDKRGRILVGRSAVQAMLVQHPEDGNGYTGFMLRIGQDDRYEFRAARKVMHAPELGALVIRRLLQAYREEMDEELKACVITVPAKFEQSACDGTREAARLAGLLYYPLLQEPIAAALAYGFTATDDRDHWMVFDLGDNTLDVSLVTVHQGQMVIPQEGHTGDNRLGGRKFDRALFDYVRQELAKTYALDGFAENNPAYRTAWGRLMLAVEQAKIELSRKEETVVELPSVLCKDARGKPVQVEVPITRTMYEKLIAPDVEKAVHVCHTLLGMNRLTAKDIDRLILIGEPTKTPYIQRVLAERLNIAIETSIDPMTAVIQGAALYATTVEIPEECRARGSVPESSAGTVDVKLEYERESNLPTHNVLGKVKSPITSQGGLTVEIRRTDGLWSSGWLPIDEHGMFSIDVALLDQKQPRLSRFTTTVFDCSGQPVASVHEPGIWYPSPELEEALVESHSAIPREGCLRGDLTRLLASSLNRQLLGVEMTMDLYARNGFRFIGIPACATDALLENAAQRFRNIYKLDSAMAVKSCVQIGYDTHVRIVEDDVRECLTRLQDPRYRILYEVFWPHVSDELFSQIKSHRNIAAPQVIQSLTEVAQHAKGQTGLLARHALAVAYHNQAIAQELAFGTGTAEWTDKIWLNALTYWAEILATDDFWAYLRKRVIDFDDPRVKPDDVEQLRANLPCVLLGFNALWALTYDQAGEPAACYKHLAFIHQSELPAAARSEVLISTVQTLTERRLKPLIQQAETELLDASGKLSRQQFTRICTPLLEGAFAVRNYLANDLHLAPSLVARMEFDGLCDCVLKAINKKINYDSDDRLRSILYGSLVTKQMLGLPLSSSMRAMLEQARRNDTNILYRDFLSSSNQVDSTVCWFLDGEETDPDASLELPVYKITNREVQVDYTKDTAGISVGYNARRVFVPRSTKAKASHQGRPIVPPEALAEHQRAIQQIEQDGTGQIAQQQAQQDAAIANERAACAQRQHAHQQQDASTVAEAKSLMAAEQAKRDRALQQEEAQCNAALQQNTQERDSRLAAPKDVVARTQRLRGWYRLEFPLLLCSGAVMGGVLGALSQAMSLLEDPKTQAAVWAVPFVSALIIGAGVRRVRRWWVRRRIDHVTRQCSDNAQHLKRDSTTKKEAIERSFRGATEKARQTLARFEEQSTQIERQSATQIAQIERSYGQVITGIERQTQQQVATLKEQFRQKYEARPEKTKTDFLAYRGAKAAGYKDGTEPSRSEMEMTSAERNEARMRFEMSALLRGR